MMEPVPKKWRQKEDHHWAGKFTFRMWWSKTSLTWFLCHWGFLHSSVGKNSTCSAGDPSLIPGSGRSPGEGKGYPLQYSGLENSMDCIVHGVSKSWTQMSTFPFYPIASSDFHAAVGHSSLHPDSFLSMLFCHRACSRAGEVHSIWQRYGLEVPQVTISCRQSSTNVCWVLVDNVLASLLQGDKSESQWQWWPACDHNDYISTMYPLRTFPPFLTILAPSFLLLK